jgi:hypothetical protein
MLLPFFVKIVWGVKQKKERKKDEYYSREYTEDYYYFIVEFKQVALSSISTAALLTLNFAHAENTIQIHNSPSTTTDIPI